MIDYAKLEIVRVPYTGKDKCPSCRGKKYVSYLNIGEYEEDKIVRKCFRCNGTGKMVINI